jgi:membrane protease YdiL (CAAX protease family)
MLAESSSFNFHPPIPTVDTPLKIDPSDTETRLNSHEEGGPAAILEKAQKIDSFSKTILMLGAFSTVDLTVTPKIVQIASQTLGLCLGNFISKPGINWVASLVNPLARLNNKIGHLFGSNITASIFVPALCEELEFRWFLQDILLKKLPKKVIEKIAPDMANIVDSMPARISRVAAAALIFAICHTHALDCAEGGGMEQLVGGLLYGALYEFAENSLVNCINLHCIYNLVVKLHQ